MPDLLGPPRPTGFWTLGIDPSPWEREGQEPPWFLSDFADDDSAESLETRRFETGVPVDCKAVACRIKYPGVPIDFQVMGSGVPVVSSGLASAVASFSPDLVQMIPFRVAESPVEIYVMNLRKVADCIDLDASVSADTGDRPSRLSEIVSPSDVVIESGRAAECPLFRPKGWVVLIVVRDDLRRAMEAAGSTGAFFDPVNSVARTS